MSRDLSPVDMSYDLVYTEPVMSPKVLRPEPVIDLFKPVAKTTKDRKKLKIDAQFVNNRSLRQKLLKSRKKEILKICQQVDMDMLNQMYQPDFQMNQIVFEVDESQYSDTVGGPLKF